MSLTPPSVGTCAPPRTQFAEKDNNREGWALTKGLGDNC